MIHFLELGLPQSVRVTRDFDFIGRDGRPRSIRIGSYSIDSHMMVSGAPDGDADSFEIKLNMQLEGSGEPLGAYIPLAMMRDLLANGTLIEG